MYQKPPGLEAALARDREREEKQQVGCGWGRGRGVGAVVGNHSKSNSDGERFCSAEVNCEQPEGGRPQDFSTSQKIVCQL